MIAGQAEDLLAEGKNRTKRPFTTSTPINGGHAPFPYGRRHDWRRDDTLMRTLTVYGESLAWFSRFRTTPDLFGNNRPWESIERRKAEQTDFSGAVMARNAPKDAGAALQRGG